MRITNIEKYCRENNKNFTYGITENGYKIDVSPNLGSELYYKFNNNKVIFYDNLNDLEGNIVSKENINYFLLNSIFPTGKTKFIDVFRLIPGKTYFFVQDKLIDIKNIKFKKLLNIDSDLFLLNFEKSILNYLSDNQFQKIGVLFSGGIDSILIVQILIKNGIKPTLYTVVPLIQNDTSLSDSVRASYCANYWSLEHKVRIVKRNINSSLITLEELKKMMPNATHTGHFS